MPLIDGIGDEVVQFGIAVIVVIVAILAWWSTNARPERYRALIQMHSRGQHSLTVSIRTRQEARNTPAQNSVEQAPAIELPDLSPLTSNSSNQTESSVVPLQEMDSIVDADMAMINHHRLHFYRRIEGMDDTESMSETSETADDQDLEPEPASIAQIEEMDSIVSAMEADLSDSLASNDVAVTNDTNVILECNSNEPAANASKEDKKDNVGKDEGAPEPAPSSAATAAPQVIDQRQKILIKLKYINDTQKEVEGSLDEPLKDFKCRHFSAELSSECRVRLIFNGRVLLDESATLRACGLHDRAVVHCLVQPSRTAPPQATPERAGIVHELVTEIVNPERHWDLENILMTLVSLALTIVWFFRCEYSNVFSATASVALFGLTVSYSVAIFGLYFSDTFQFVARHLPANEPAPAPAPAPAPEPGQEPAN